MAKKRGTRGRRPAPRRKAAKRGTGGTRKRAAAARPNGLDLKAVRAQLQRALVGIGAAAAAEPSVDETRMTMERWIAEIDAICADSKKGCGPQMIFPA